MPELLIHSMAEFADIILGVLDHAGAQVIAEVGAEYGGMSSLLAEHVAGQGGALISIDPAPKPEFLAWLETQPAVRHLAQDSLSAIPTLAGVDAWLIDGDHNWYTVYHELRAIDAIDESSAYLSVQALTAIFVAANYEEPNRSVEQRELNRANADGALMRFEFFQCLCRVSILKYVTDEEAAEDIDDVSDALERLLTGDIIPRLPPEAMHDNEVFRRNRLSRRPRRRFSSGTTPRCGPSSSSTRARSTSSRSSMAGTHGNSRTAADPFLRQTC